MIAMIISIGCIKKAPVASNTANPAAIDFVALIVQITVQMLSI
jgi:hypothetical protein